MGGGDQRVCSGGQRMSRQTCGHLGGSSDDQDMCQLDMSSSFQVEQRRFPVPSNFRYPISILYCLYMSTSPIYPRYPIIISNISLCLPLPALPRAPTCSGSSGIGSTAAVGGVAAVAGFRGALRWQPLGERKLFQLTV